MLVLEMCLLVKRVSTEQEASIRSPQEFSFHQPLAYSDHCHGVPFPSGRRRHPEPI
jgi:hypothetical protein